jgi:hypothetical protein
VLFHIRHQLWSALALMIAAAGVMDIPKGALDGVGAWVVTK